MTTPVGLGYSSIHPFIKPVEAGRLSFGAAVAAAPSGPETNVSAKPHPNIAQIAYDRVVMALRQVGRYLLMPFYFVIPHQGFQHWVEKKVIFRPELSRTYDYQARLATLKKSIEDSELKKRFEEIEFHSQDKVSHYGWYFKPVPGKPTVIFSSGINGDMTYIQKYLPLVKAGYGFLTYDYRGYGKSGGEPSEAGLYEDLNDASLYLKKNKHTPVSQQVLLGYSLGGAITADRAAQDNYYAVILQSTFTRMEEAFEDITKFNSLLSWLTPKNFSSFHKFDSIGKAERFQSPLLVIHGDRDELFPIYHANRLFEHAASKIKKQQTVRGELHGMMSDVPAAKILNFLKFVQRKKLSEKQ